jgi:hypothetical protein
VYTLSIAAIPLMGWVTNETEYRNIATDPRRIMVNEKITMAQILTSISSGVRRLLGLYPMVGIIFSPVQV